MGAAAASCSVASSSWILMLRCGEENPRREVLVSPDVDARMVVLRLNIYPQYNFGILYNSFGGFITDFGDLTCVYSAIFYIFSSLSL